MQHNSISARKAVAPLKTIALNRMGFGPRKEDSAAYDALGSSETERFEAYVAQQLNPDGIDDSALDTFVAGAGFVTLDKTQSELWIEYYRDAADMTSSSEPRDEVTLMKFHRAVHSKKQLQEVLVDFWHDHFNIYAGSSPMKQMIVSYDRDVIRPNILGNFRTFLEAVAKSTAMLYYLDNYNNKVAGPNENYARELLELHTMGAENYLGIMRQSDVPGYPDDPIGYVDDDVYEATRCFTGWAVQNKASDPMITDTGDFYYNASVHDRFQKTVLGKFFPADQAALDDGKQVLDLLANHPGTARYICRKLCTRLISDNPPAAIIASAVAVFQANITAPDQLKKVIEHILLSDTFRTTWGEKTKRPFGSLVSAIRILNGNYQFKPNDSVSNSVLYRAIQSSHRSFYWAPPTGFPDEKGYWLNSTSMLMVWRSINWLITKTDANDVNLVDCMAEMPAGLTTATTVADYWIGRIFGRTIPQSDRQVIINFMADESAADEALDFTSSRVTQRVASMVGLILGSPEFLHR